jgi:hypothetical protein
MHMPGHRPRENVSIAESCARAWTRLTFEAAVRRRHATDDLPRSTTWKREPAMRYMMIVTGPENLAASGPPPAALFEAIDEFVTEAVENGKIVSFGGLKPTSTGARMRIANGKVVTTDGPFTESKEVIGGFSIFEVASREEALEEARKFMELHRVHWPNWEGQTEIRLMYEAEDDVRSTQIEGSRRLENSR